VASLFGLFHNSDETHNRPSSTFTASISEKEPDAAPPTAKPTDSTSPLPAYQEPTYPQPTPTTSNASVYQLQISGPGLNSTLTILEEEDIIIAQALLEKMRRQLRAREL
jgi:hypothetical protein